MKGKYSTAVEPGPDAPQIMERGSLRPATWKKEVPVAENSISGQQLLDDVLHERDNPAQVNVSKATGIEGLHLSIGVLSNTPISLSHYSVRRGAVVELVMFLV